MLSVSIRLVKNALCKVLNSIPDFNQMRDTQKGKVIDLTFKSILTDLMTQFGMIPGVDYVDNLKDNEPSTDFVALSKRADDLLTGLMEGKIIAINAYVRKDKAGNINEVQAHFRKKAS